MSNEHKYNMIMILRKLYSLINESNICHLISGQHRQHITNNYVIFHVFQQQRYMISALQEHARKAPQSADAALVEMTANYLQACHLIFEKGILSHLTITERYQQVLENIKKGFSFFTDWSLSHQRTGKCITLIMIQCFLLSILTLSLQFEVLTLRTLLFYYIHHS